jgi:phenylacetate-CoA ligase
MFLHPRQLAEVMARFPEVTAYQAVIRREAHRDELTLQVVPAAGTDMTDLARRLQAVSREALKFRLVVEAVETADLPADSPPIRDERTWE